MTLYPIDELAPSMVLLCRGKGMILLRLKVIMVDFSVA